MTIGINPMCYTVTFKFIILSIHTSKHVTVTFNFNVLFIHTSNIK